MGKPTADQPDFGRDAGGEVAFVDKELAWKKNRIGYFTASDLDRLMSKTDVWTKDNIDYLYAIQYARTMGVLLSSPPNRNFRLGRENEPYAIAWLRANKPELGEIQHCDVDFDEKIFFKTEFGFGLSPDAFVIPSEREYEDYFEICEMKSAVGMEERSRMFSETYPYDKKRIRVWEQHRWQIVGQFVGCPKLKKVHLLKYDSVDEDNDTDERSVLDPRRGILFTFTREEAGAAIDRVIERASFANDYLNAGLDPDDINEYWKKKGKIFV